MGRKSAKPTLLSKDFRLALLAKRPTIVAKERPSVQFDCAKRSTAYRKRLR